MSFTSHNNNDQITNTTYSSYSFSNAETSGTKISFTFFNRLLKVSIAAKKDNNNNDYTSYDNENATYCYVSYTKAKILHDLIDELMRGSVHNVCIETNQGLLMVSDGVEYGADSPCISITKNNNGNMNTVLYQTKKNYHKGACNYDINSGNYDNRFFDNLELEAFQNLLMQYYDAASYALAASIMEANMYKRNALASAVYAIADKVGAKTSSGNNGGGKYNNNSSFLNNNGGSSNSNNGGGMNGVPKEYEAKSYDDIVNGMMG